MNTLSPFIYDIRIYQFTAVISLLILIVAIPFSIVDPGDMVRVVVRDYFNTVINDMNLSRGVVYTTGQLRHNLDQYRDRIEDSIQMTGYDGSIRDIDIRILDLRDYYARANVVVVANQSFLYASYLTVERIFDVELAKTDDGWKIMSAVQQRMEYKLWD